MLNEIMLEELAKTSIFAYQKGFADATTGSFSARIDDHTMVISAANKDKSIFTKHDFIICDMDANLLSGDANPSPEVKLHGMIYQQHLQANCILQTHSVHAMVLSLFKAERTISFEGYEVQKMITGIETYDEKINLPIFDNEKSMGTLLSNIKARWLEANKVKGLLVRGAGLYSWASTVSDAKRQMEAWEFLLQCEFARQSLK